MKREFLQNFKIEDQALPKEVIDAILDENSRDIEATKGKFRDYEDLKVQLAEAGKTIEGFKALDVDGIKKAADEWKAKAEQAEKDAAARIADMEFSGLLTKAITEAKGKSAKAISALLDTEALKASKNQEADIKAALEALKEESGYLFESQETPPPYASGTGTAPAGGMTRKVTIAQTNTKKPIIVTDTPYAKYLFYGKVMKGRAPKVATRRDLQYTRDKNPMAGPFWDRALVAAEGPALRAELQGFMDRRRRG